ncbi:MAG: BACON domain-containing protein [Alistipes sp.]|nr:BACON domain-containing protein [Alistipes sp.]
MKNLFKSMMAIAVAAMSFTACSNDLTEDVTPSQEFTVQINAVENLSRTHFGNLNEGKYPTLWDATDKIAASLANGNNKASNVATYVSDDSKTASFKVELNTTNATAPYVVYAASPSTAVVSGVHATNKYWNLNIPSSQEPSATSCDPAAQIVVGQSESSETLPSSVNIEFSHVTAYAKINFTNVALGEAKVESINIEADQNIAGRFLYYVAGEKVGTTEANSATNIITIGTSELTNVWVALAPTAVSELTFTINTDKGTITKEVAVNKEFKSGVVATFNVDMTGKTITTPDVYTLVTDLSVLAEGDNVVIAAAGYDFAMSTTWNSNNNAHTAITKSDNTITPTAAVQILTVYDAGTNLYKFSAGKDGENEKYIYAPGGGNRLRVTTTEADNCYWDITIDSTTGAATMVAQTTDTRKIIRYNSSGLFSCYASGQEDVALYYKSNGGEKIAIEPQISANDVTGISYEGVTNATFPVVIRGISGTVNVTPDGTIVTSATLNNNVVTYSVAENTGSTTRTGTITLSNGTTSHTVNVEQGKPVTVTLPYSETFAESQGDWTIKNVDLGGASAIWTRNSYDGTFFMKASGYAATANTESWLISPIISLEDATNPQISFMHAQKYATSTQTEYLTLHVKTTDAAEWTQLTIPTYDTSNSYTWTNSGTISLAAYKDQNIQIGFKYVSDPSNEATWEIKDVVVKEAE